MIRVVSCLLLSSTLSIAFPFPSPAVPIPFPSPAAPVPLPPGPVPPTSVVPNPFPFAPSGPRPGVPVYNSPYYNNAAGGPQVPIVSYSSEHGGDGTYAFSFTTADGKQAQENGYLKDAYIDNAGEPQGTQVVQGSYAYISPEGTPIQVSYVADENGFRPSGVHIHTDAKAVVPFAENDRRPFDPRYNRYNPFNPYNDRNRYNPLGQYNNLRPYDPRYPYDPTMFNPYLNNPYPITAQNIATEEAKKESK